MLLNCLVLVGGMVAGQLPGAASPGLGAPTLAPPPPAAASPLSAQAPTSSYVPAAAPSGNAPVHAQTLAPDLMAEALAARQGGAVNGRPLMLAAALGSATDRRQQLEVVHAYWRLTEALARYNFHFDHQQQLRQLSARGDDSSLMAAAGASAAAGVRDAELAVVTAQHDLLAAGSFPSGAPLFVPADRPHLGAYRTNFNELFSMRAAPPRARLIDEILPPLLKAIDVRANAVGAALRAQSAAIAAYQAGRVDLGTALSCMVEYQRQREAFVDVVCRYNDNIADYALNVAGITASGPGLVSLLISQPQGAASPQAASSDAGMGGPGGSTTVGVNPPASGMIPGTMIAPPDGGTLTGGGVPMLRSGVPTLAPPRPSDMAQGFGSPTPAPFSTPTLPPAAGNAPSLAPVFGQPTLAPPPGQPTLAPPASGQPAALPGNTAPRGVPSAGLAPPLVPMAADGRVVPATAVMDGGPPPTGNAPPTANPPTGNSSLAAPAAFTPDPARQAAPLPPPPAEVSPPDKDKDDWRAPAPKQSSARARVWLVARQGAGPPAETLSKPDARLAPAALVAQAKMLAATLYGPQAGAERWGEPVALVDCLRGRAPAQRQTTIEAFWTARQRAAEYGMLLRQREMFAGLSSAAAARGGATAAGLTARLESAQLAAEAQILEGRAALLEAQFELAAQLGRPATAAWPLPSGVPNAGPYAVRLETLPADRAGLPGLRRLSFTLPILSRAVQEHATAVLEAERNRADVVTRFDPAAANIEKPVAAIGRQTAATFAFLRILSEFNRAIAGYALAVLPAGAPAEQLAGALAAS